MGSISPFIQQITRVFGCIWPIADHLKPGGLPMSQPCAWSANSTASFRIHSGTPSNSLLSPRKNTWGKKIIGKHEENDMFGSWGSWFHGLWHNPHLTGFTVIFPFVLITKKGWKEKRSHFQRDRNQCRTGEFSSSPYLKRSRLLCVTHFVHPNGDGWVAKSTLPKTNSSPLKNDGFQ